MLYTNINNFDFIGYAGVSKPGCQTDMLALIKKENVTSLLLHGTNNGVTGQFVYPLTNRICYGKFLSTTKSNFL